MKLDNISKKFPRLKYLATFIAIYLILRSILLPLKMISFSFLVICSGYFILRLLNQLYKKESLKKDNHLIYIFLFILTFGGFAIEQHLQVSSQKTNRVTKIFSSLEMKLEFILSAEETFRNYKELITKQKYIVLNKIRNQAGGTGKNLRINTIDGTFDFLLTKDGLIKRTEVSKELCNTLLSDIIVGIESIDEYNVIYKNKYTWLHHMLVPSMKLFSSLCFTGIEIDMLTVESLNSSKKIEILNWFKNKQMKIPAISQIYLEDYSTIKTMLSDSQGNATVILTDEKIPALSASDCVEFTLRYFGPSVDQKNAQALVNGLRNGLDFFVLGIDKLPSDAVFIKSQNSFVLNIDLKLSNIGSQICHIFMKPGYITSEVLRL
jgi:hypothetical protein